MKTLEIIDYEKIENLNKASYAVNRNVGRTLDENDARGMVEGIIENHMGVVIDVLAKRGIKDRATIEVIKDFVRDR